MADMEKTRKVSTRLTDDDIDRLDAESKLNYRTRTQQIRAIIYAYWHDQDESGAA